MLLEDTRMRGDDIDLDEMLGPDPTAEEPENLVDAAPPNKTPGRALLDRAARYPVNRFGTGQRAAKKNTPEMLTRILNYAAEVPVGASVALRAGISYSTLKYWLQKSSEGAPGDGFDVPMGENDETGTEDNTLRFHIAWDFAMMAGAEKVKAATMQRATGYLEPLTYQGRVQYKWDPEKLAASRELGLPEFVPENYLLDEFKAPVPETVLKMDPDLAMFVLKALHPEFKPKAIDVNVRGGVLVVGMRAVTSEALNELEDTYRKEGRPAVTFEEDDE
jgi:hypothetical protein